MTAAQRTKLMSQWWPAACAAQGWDAKDRELRLRALSEAVGRPLASASDLDAHGDIDRVKAHLYELASPDDFSAAMLAANPAEDGERRRLFWKIRKFSAEYVGAIVYGVTHGVTRDPEELTLDQLRRLAVTLEERRRAAVARRIMTASAGAGEGDNHE